MDHRRGLLTLPTSKSGKPRFIELSSVVLDTLARVPRHLGEPRIFPDCRRVTHHFPAWVEEAKLPGKVTLHTMRHTYGGCFGISMRESCGAEGGTRTPTPLRALDPESSASANSATSAPSRFPTLSSGLRRVKARGRGLDGRALT